MLGINGLERRFEYLQGVTEEFFFILLITILCLLLTYKGKCTIFIHKSRVSTDRSRLYTIFLSF